MHAVFLPFEYVIVGSWKVERAVCGDLTFTVELYETIRKTTWNRENGTISQVGCWCCKFKLESFIYETKFLSHENIILSKTIKISLIFSKTTYAIKLQSTNEQIKYPIKID